MTTLLVTTSSYGVHDDTPLKKLQAHSDVVLNPYGRKLTEDEISQLIETHQPVGILAGVEPLTRTVLEKATRLKTIARAGIGMDSVDQKAAADLGISVTNTPDAPTQAVAELTLGMILSLLRGLGRTDRSIRAGEWDRPMGRLLSHLSVGIVGCGRIGSTLSNLLEPFGCKILGCDPAPACTPNFAMLGLEELLGKADIISLHLPYCDSTHHFMNAERLAAMRPGSYLVNAARGGLVDETALAEALASGHLAGAALDCFESEPYSGPLTEQPNALLTAHIGSYAREGRIIMETLAAENLLASLGDA